MAEPKSIAPSSVYEHLPGAPIVEAVIHWQARATQTWQPNELQQKLAVRLPEYPKIEPQHLYEVAFEAEMKQGAAPPTASRQESWHGIRLHDEAQTYIAQFTLDGLVFSRLRPYENWDRFEAEGRRLWNVFRELAGPVEIQRLGVRYINRISSADFTNLRDYLREPPSLTSDFELNSFLYQSTFDVPGDAIGVRVIKAMQPQLVNEPGLIIDIDTFTTSPLPCEDSILNECLPKLRLLKNRVFFELLTPDAIERFKRAKP